MPLVRSALSLVVLVALGAAGVLTTQATFADQVTMAAITVTGGTLDLKANSGDGPNQAWTGSLSAALTGMKPGDEQFGTVVIKNAGNLPFTLTVSTTGTDTNSCFSYYFRETAATGATKAAGWPVNVSSMGSAVGADGTTANFAAAVTGNTLYDISTSDAIWETDDIKTYTLTVRMKTACATNGATGALNFTFNATQ